MDDLLSPHFSLRELTITEHRGIDNTPTPAITERLRFLASRLETVRACVGAPIFVTSGYRCPQLNAAVHGAPDSDHTYGLAADIHAPSLTTTQLYRTLYDQREALGYRQLIWEFGSWVHVAFFVAGSGQKPKPPLDSRVIYPKTTEYLAYVPGQTLLA